MVLDFFKYLRIYDYNYQYLKIILWLKIFFYFLEWLWADYMLYNYFKDRFVRKLDELGRQRLEYEKEVLRNLSDGTLHRCKQEPVANFCQYFNKGEIKFLDELRENQRNKSLKLLKSRNDIKLKQNKG